MVHKVNILANHPLSRFHAYPELRLGTKVITSIEMGRAYILLVQHGHRYLADQMLMDDHLKWEPRLIAQWVARHGVVPSAEFIARSTAIYEAVILDQLVKNGNKHNPLRKVFKDLLKQGVTPDDVQFIVYSSAKEKVFSCGLEMGNMDPDPPGMHMYANVLHNVLVRFAADKKHLKNPRLPILMDGPLLGQLDFPKSACVISDSQCRYFDTVQGGDVIPVSGGTYKDMTNVLRNGDLSLNKYMYIIVYCGTNCTIKKSYSADQREDDWQELKDVLVALANSRPKYSVLFVCAFDHPAVRDNARHARAVTLGLVTTNVMCLNWRDQGNRFIRQDGRVIPRYFERGNFHLNHRGSILFWKSLCAMLPLLGWFSYTLSAQPQSVNKEIFSSDRPGPSGHKRARITQA